MYDCNDVKDIHGIEDGDFPTHKGYHYCSTAVEWHWLLYSMNKYSTTGEWCPHVSLNDGIKAVEMGLAATKSLGWNK